MNSKKNHPILFIVMGIYVVFALHCCVSKRDIKVPLADPLPHPKLAQMKELSVEEEDGIQYFGESKKYLKSGVIVVSLKGNPYEMGYAHGTLLKDEMKAWIRDALYWAKSKSYGSSLMENTLIDRAKEVKQYIPEKYQDEIMGLSAGSGIDYEYILALNTALTTSKAYYCTSVAIQTKEGKLIRSRSNEGSLGHIAQPVVLFINQPKNGYAFASLMVPGLIGVWTAMNETGLNIGDHSIWKSSNEWKGIPNEILNRKIIENANSVEEVEEILKEAPRSRPWMHMVADSNNARIYEYDSENIGYKDMDEPGLILTNNSKVLKIGVPYSCNRYMTARDFLKKNQDQMSVSKFIELNRSESISRTGAFDQRYVSHSLAIFIPEDLDFWVAVDPPPASRGRWVGFNLKKELDNSGSDPNPALIN